MSIKTRKVILLYRVQCRVEIDTLNYSILFLVFPQLLPCNGCFWNSNIRDFLGN